MEHQVKLGYLNIQSLKNLNSPTILKKLNQLKGLIERKQPDVLAITESWLRNDRKYDALEIDGYTLFREDRPYDERGGGVLLYVRAGLEPNRIQVPRSESADQLFVSICFNGNTYVIGVVYDPPLKKNYSVNDKKNFVDALRNSLVLATEVSNTVVCVGDVNVNFLDTDSSLTRYFSGMLSRIGFIQMIREPTHYTSTETLIDVLLCKEPRIVTEPILEELDGFSKHRYISCNIGVTVTSDDNSNSTTALGPSSDDDIIQDSIRSVNTTALSLSLLRI
ncbi:unnamed protein product [Acanthoscelides obtectus]|uniref:Endonuclease/exonuclease/phosphatase domain-containing protein n=1 Tax=Acanthoscelides obtectus TaxID=200917 RepID=A0A9P0PCF9_ACAOB|nr:unnamed protein product [Acanthoscelides obtectus]CAK1635909.1 hypothetical protein AOBTE_LOCUS9616 [Acanthoscelides obtectus]